MKTKAFFFFLYSARVIIYNTIYSIGSATGAYLWSMGKGTSFVLHSLSRGCGPAQHTTNSLKMTGI